MMPMRAMTSFILPHLTILGIRLLGERVTDFMVGEALTMFAPDVNIYISSWGPVDDGRTMRSPGKFMNMALQKTGIEVIF